MSFIYMLVGIVVLLVGFTVTALFPPLAPIVWTVLLIGAVLLMLPLEAASGNQDAQITLFSIVTVVLLFWGWGQLKKLLAKLSGKRDDRGR